MLPFDAPCDTHCDTPCHTPCDAPCDTHCDTHTLHVQVKEDSKSSLLPRYKGQTPVKGKSNTAPGDNMYVDCAQVHVQG